MSQKSLRMVVEPSRAEIAPVIDAMAELCARRGIGEEVRRVLALVLDDLLTNVASYAFPEGNGSPVTVALTTFDDRVAVEIRDGGIPFNPFERPPPDTTAPLEERDVGGLGIHLIEELVDETHYERSDGHNVVTVIKHFGSGDQ